MNDFWGICFLCGEKMIHLGDDDHIDADEREGIIANFACHTCDASAEFYYDYRDVERV